MSATVQRIEESAWDGVRYSAFSRNVMSVLDRIEYRRCDRGEDLEAVYRLRYKSFKRHGLLLSEASDQKMVDALDEAPNCHKFGVFMNGDLVSTVRLHHLSRETAGSPAMTVFSDVLQPRLDRGETFIDPSRLSVDPDLVGLHRVLPHITLRLAFIANIHFGTTACIFMIREEHTAFYARNYHATPIGRPRPYPPFTMPIYLYETRYDLNMRRTIERFPFYYSTPVEQRMLFAAPKAGQPAPLTVLPTAKYLQHAA